jgi:protein SCO1/2
MELGRFLTALGSLVLAVSLLAASLGAVGCRQAETFNGEVVDSSGEPLELAGLNWNGERFRLSDHQGQVVIVFFGYTYCPDVCPFTLAKMKQLYAKLGERAEDVAVVFVSVDPHRDTVEKLADYVPSFDERFYGVRLEFDELDTVSEDFDLTVQYGQPKDGPGTDSYYYVDHTGTFFVFGRDGRLRLKYPPNTQADEMLPDVEALLTS